MSSTLSADDRMTVERFVRRARESTGGLAERVKALGDEGLVNLVSRDNGWELALAVIAAITHDDRILARAAATNLVAADLVYRWARCDNLRLLEPIVKGRGIAALANGPQCIKLDVERGQLFLSGRCGQVPLLPIADTVIVVAASGENVAVLALAPDEPGLSIKPGDPGPDGLPCASAILTSVAVARLNLIGTNPISESEPDELLFRLTQVSELF